ncbi:unnamed protein product [Thelazia callipaeda]|uniref:Uncharacterized protein n=1 Tax=Thelazia callipaeda TaxID=103827 RepID=A0A0N5D4D6_THECL|nr:unnamed protein product [Thelazia callipaeda]
MGGCKKNPEIQSSVTENVKTKHGMCSTGAKFPSNTPLFRLANDSTARVAKALTRHFKQFKLGDNHCRLLQNHNEEELEKQLIY